MLVNTVRLRVCFFLLVFSATSIILGFPAHGLDGYVLTTLGHQSTDNIYDSGSEEHIWTGGAQGYLIDNPIDDFRITSPFPGRTTEQLWLTFDFSSLPANIDITGAVLGIYQVDAPSSGNPYPADVRAVRSAWPLGTFPVIKPELGPSLATTTIRANAGWVYFSSPDFSEQVRRWVNGTDTHFGINVFTTDTDVPQNNAPANFRIGWTTVENEGYQPFIVVTYDVIVPTPTMTPTPEPPTATPQIPTSATPTLALPSPTPIGNKSQSPTPTTSAVVTPIPSTVTIPAPNPSSPLVGDPSTSPTISQTPLTPRVQTLSKDTPTSLIALITLGLGILTSGGYILYTRKTKEHKVDPPTTSDLTPPSTLVN